MWILKDQQHAQITVIAWNSKAADPNLSKDENRRSMWLVAWSEGKCCSNQRSISQQKRFWWVEANNSTWLAQRSDIQFVCHRQNKVQHSTMTWCRVQDICIVEWNPSANQVISAGLNIVTHCLYWMIHRSERWDRKQGKCNNMAEASMPLETLAMINGVSQPESPGQGGKMKESETREKAMPESNDG